MLFFVHDGAMELTLNGTPAIAGAGQIVLFDCREPYSYAASDGLEFTWLLFNGLNARAFYQKILQAAAAAWHFRPAAPAEIAANAGFSAERLRRGRAAERGTVLTADPPGCCACSCWTRPPRAPQAETVLRRPSAI